MELNAHLPFCDLFLYLNLLDLIMNATKLQPRVMLNVTKKPQQYEGSATVIVKNSYHVQDSSPIILLNYSNRTTENAWWTKELTSKSKFPDDNHSPSQSSFVMYRIVVVMCWRLDFMILEVFSNLKDSMIL